MRAHFGPNMTPCALHIAVAWRRLVSNSGTGTLTQTHPQPDVISLLRAALEAADQAGLGLVACHIDLALALAQETLIAGHPVRTPATSLM